MHFLSTVLAFARLVVLGRQMREVRRVLADVAPSVRPTLAALIFGEMQRAEKHPVPHLYGTVQIDPYQPWGDASETAYQRLCSDNPQLRVRGLATWLTVVFHETQNARQLGLQAIHGELATVLQAHRDSHAKVVAQRMAA